MAPALTSSRTRVVRASRRLSTGLLNVRTNPPGRDRIYARVFVSAHVTHAVAGDPFAAAVPRKRRYNDNGDGI